MTKYSPITFLLVCVCFALSFVHHKHFLIPIIRSESKFLAVSESKFLAVSESKFLAVSESKFLAVSESKFLAVSESKFWQGCILKQVLARLYLKASSL